MCAGSLEIWHKQCHRVLYKDFNGIRFTEYVFSRKNIVY